MTGSVLRILTYHRVLDAAGAADPPNPSLVSASPAAFAAQMRLLARRYRVLSVEEVAREVAERGATAGTATVYRTLELLVRSGLVVERDFGEGFKRFEPARGIPHHEHLLCTVCGRVTEFRDERLERMTTLIAEAHGYSRQRHRLVIYGVCEECRTGRTGRP